MQGWIKLHRDITHHWIFKKPEYFQAWVIMLINVNFEDKKVLIDGELIECKRGEALFSIENWAKMFGKKWSRQRVRTLFKILENESMIEQKGMRKTTKVTICNYDTYQDVQPTDNQQITNREPTENQQVTNRKPQLKNVKKDKNVKKEKEEERVPKKVVKNGGRNSVEDSRTFYNKEFKEALEEVNRIKKDGIDVKKGEKEFMKAYVNEIDNYRKLIGFIFGGSELKTPLVGILSMPSQLTYDQFVKLRIKQPKNKTMLDILTGIENDDKYFKTKKILYRTILTWFKDRK